MKRENLAACAGCLRFQGGKIGILLVNLGTPDEPTVPSVRRYLAQFLADRRVIEVPRLQWWFILNGIVLRTRPKRVTAAYRRIWDADTGDSPLRAITRLQADRLSARFEADEALQFDFAMRYGAPSISMRIRALQEQGCDRLIILPLYPQYCAATTASVADEVFSTLTSLRWQPAVRIGAPYFDHRSYIPALASNVRKQLAGLDFTPERILLSYHGVPESYIERGDPYRCHCCKTTRQLRAQMGWSPTFALQTFQSRFGREPWLQPYTDETLKTLAQQSVTKIVLIAPGFSTDCLETLEENGIENRDLFLSHGGKNFKALTCLNDSSQGMTFLEDLCRDELAGWWEENPGKPLLSSTSDDPQ